MVIKNSTDSGGEWRENLIVRQLITVFFITIAVSGNCLVLLAIYKFRSLRTISNLIILNLSLTDLLFSLTAAPTTVYMWSKDHVKESNGLCIFIGVDAEFLSVVSIYTLVFVSIERFLATNYPLKHRSVFTKKTVKIGLLVIWIFSAVLCAFTFIAVKKYVYIENFYHCMIDWESVKEVSFVMLLFAIILPFLTLVSCNVLILRAIWKSRRFISENTAASPQRNVGFWKEHQTTFLTIAMIMAFLLLWMPYSVAGASLALGTFSLPKEVMLASLMLAALNAALNPFIYGVMNKNFRVAFVKIMCRRKT